MNPGRTDAETQIGATSACPSCGSKGRSVKPVTIEALVDAEARRRVGHCDGFRFCARPSCPAAYFHAETGDTFLCADVRVRIGQKETTPPRPVCYCFGHTAEEIEAEVRETGFSRIPEDIAEKCRRGQHRCEQTNPQGSCCLGNVRRVLKDARAKTAPGAAACASVAPASKKPPSLPGARVLLQVGAVLSAIAASACCWLPLLLVLFGVSGGAFSAIFEAWRPILFLATLAFLGLAFYFAYRKPKSDACCTPTNRGRTAASKTSKAILWVVTASVLALAFFPNYVGYLFGGSDAPPAWDELDQVVVKIDGMTCAGCAAGIEKALRKIPGVEAADVSFERAEALIGVPNDGTVPRTEILSAIARAGDYTGTIVERDRAALAADGMESEERR